MFKLMVKEINAILGPNPRIDTKTFELNNCPPENRAATFTRVNGTVSCFCNKRLQNRPTVYTNFVT